MGTMDEVIYECGATGVEDSVSPHCPMCGAPIIEMCKFVGSCEASCACGGFPKCYKPLSGIRSPRCTYYEGESVDGSDK